MSCVVCGEWEHGMALEVGCFVFVLVAPSISFFCDSYFYEYRDHTGSPGIPVGECRVI